MICEHIFAADDGDFNDDDIDDDGNLIMHDCVYRDDDECDDHRHTSMFQLALLHIFLEFFPDVFLHCDCRMHVCGCMCMCRSCVWCGGMKYDGEACAFMKTCANAHFCVKLLRLYATCFCAALLFYFVEVYFGLYFAAVDVPPSSSSQALTTRP